MPTVVNVVLSYSKVGLFVLFPSLVMSLLEKAEESQHFINSEAKTQLSAFLFVFLFSLVLFVCCFVGCFNFIKTLRLARKQMGGLLSSSAVRTIGRGARVLPSKCGKTSTDYSNHMTNKFGQFYRQY